MGAGDRRRQVAAELEREKLRRVDVANTLWTHIGELHQDLRASEARLEAVKALLDEVAGVTVQKSRIRAALSVAPQPEPDERDRTARKIHESHWLPGELMPTCGFPAEGGLCSKAGAEADRLIAASLSVDVTRLIDPELAHGRESSEKEMRKLRADLAAERDGTAS